MKFISVRELGCAQASWMNNYSDRESMRLLLKKLATFEPKWRRIALAFRLVIGACRRSYQQARKRRNKDGCWGKERNHNWKTDIQIVNSYAISMKSQMGNNNFHLWCIVNWGGKKAGEKTTKTETKLILLRIKFADAYSKCSTMLFEKKKIFVNNYDKRVRQQHRLFSERHFECHSR